MMSESIAGGRIMPEHMGDQGIDQRFSVNRSAGRSGVDFRGQRPADLMNQWIADFAGADQFDAVGLYQLSRLARDEIRLEVNPNVLKLLFPDRLILLAHRHDARLADSSFFLNDLPSGHYHRSFIRSIQRDVNVVYAQLVVGHFAGAHADVPDFHPRPG